MSKQRLYIASDFARLDRKALNALGIEWIKRDFADDAVTVKETVRGCSLVWDTNELAALFVGRVQSRCEYFECSVYAGRQRCDLAIDGKRYGAIRDTSLEAVLAAYGEVLDSEESES